MKYYQEWLKDDRGRDADPVLRNAVKAQWLAHNQEVQKQAQQAQQQAIAGPCGYGRCEGSEPDQSRSSQDPSKIQEKTVEAKLRPAPTGDTGAKSQGPSESISYKDLPPEGKLQMAAQAGIQLNPQGLQAAADAENAPEPMEPDTSLQDHALELNKADQAHKHRLEEIGAQGMMDHLKAQASDARQQMMNPAPMPQAPPMGPQGPPPQSMNQPAPQGPDQAAPSMDPTQQQEVPRPAGTTGATGVEVNGINSRNYNWAHFWNRSR